VLPGGVCNYHREMKPFWIETGDQLRWPLFFGLVVVDGLLTICSC
jgi:hypothetical protein